MLSYAAEVEESELEGILSTLTTLLEPLLILILGVLAALIVPNILDRPDQARIVAAQNDIRQLLSALKLYRLDHLNYASTDQGIQALVNAPANRSGIKTKYVEVLPQDPWGKPYQYLHPGKNGEIGVFSLGKKDGRIGGEGYNADIGSWNIGQ